MVGTVRNEVGKKRQWLEILCLTQGLGCPKVGDGVIEGGTGSDLGALEKLYFQLLPGYLQHLKISKSIG